MLSFPIELLPCKITVAWAIFHGSFNLQVRHKQNILRNSLIPINQHVTKIEPLLKFANSESTNLAKTRSVLDIIIEVTRKHSMYMFRIFYLNEDLRLGEGN